MPDRSLPNVERKHLEAITGPLGIWQHVNGVTPDEAFGVCTDDVSRALTVDLLHRHELGWEAVSPSARRSMAFLLAAFDTTSGSFRNFRSADGVWLDGIGSQDCQGRALLALGIAAREAPEVGLRVEALRLLEAAMPAARDLTSPRAVASVILACDAALAAGMIDEAQPTFAHLVQRLGSLFSGLDVDGEWPWPELTLTYESALLPHALIVAGRRLDDPDLRRVGLDVLDWLIGAQAAHGGAFSPVGNDGWWSQGKVRSRFDQQPIEATAMILAAAAAFEVTEDAAYRRAAEAAYGWFLGDNDAGIPVAVIDTGGCHDGLSADHVNLNQGAESTLMWLTAVESMRLLRARASDLRIQRTRPVTPVVVAVRS